MASQPKKIHSNAICSIRVSFECRRKNTFIQQLEMKWTGKFQKDRIHLWISNSWWRRVEDQNEKNIQIWFQLHLSWLSVRENWLKPKQLQSCLAGGGRGGCTRGRWPGAGHLLVDQTGWLLCFWRFPELILGKRTDEKNKSLEFNQSYFLEAVFLRWKPLVCGPLHGRGSVCLKKEGEVLSTWYFPLLSEKKMPSQNECIFIKFPARAVNFKEGKILKGLAS